MSLRINTAEVRSVLLAVGWRDVVPGSFRMGDLEFTTGAESPAAAGEQLRWPAGLGFECATEDGELLAGPLSSVLAVSYTAPEKPVGSSFEQAAEMLQGEVVLVEGEPAVYFGFGTREFELWLDSAGQWAVAMRGHRTGGRNLVSHTGLHERDLGMLQTVVMGEIKGGFGTPGQARADADQSAAADTFGGSGEQPEY